MPDGSVSPAKSLPAQEEPSAGSSTKQDDPLGEVVTILSRVAIESRLKETDVGLTGTIAKLAEQGMEPGRLEQPPYRTGVAYAVQDLEKYSGSVSIGMPPALRAELTELAGTSPGLQDAQMRSLVARTVELTDRELILDIRRTAQQAARPGADPDSPEMRSQIEALEKRADITQAASARLNNTELPPPSRVEQATPAGLERSAGKAPSVERPQPSQTDASSGKPTTGVSETTSATADHEKVHATPSPGSGRPEVPSADIVPAPRSGATAGSAQPSAVATTPAVMTAPLGAAEAGHAGFAQPQRQSILGGIANSMRRPAPLNPAPWTVPAPALGPRIAQFEQRLADGRTERLIQNAERSGTAMMAAMERFAGGPGRGIMSKLEGVAANEPGGLPAVIAGMKPGGRYAAERAEFDTALRDPAVSAAYDTIAGSAAQYARDRYAVSNNLHTRKLDPGSLGDRFETIEASLGEQASSIPGREAGKDALGEMAQKLAELLRRAMERVRQAFGKAAGVEAQATPRSSPSPSPSP